MPDAALAPDLAPFIERVHRALEAFRGGNPEPIKALWSHGGDVTLANPFGPPVRGWSLVQQTLERTAAQLRDGEAHTFERVALHAAADFAYTVQIERYRVRAGGAAGMGSVSLRATTIFRREAGGWRIVHRHADPIASPRPPESILQQEGDSVSPPHAPS